MGNALGENRARDPGSVVLTLGEVDHCLLPATEVERRVAALHRLTDRLDVGVGVAVQELEEEAEVFGVALMGSCREHEDVVGAVAEKLAQPVPHALLALRGGEAMVWFR